MSARTKRRATPARETANRADELRHRVAQRNVAAILDATVAQLEHDPKPNLVQIAKTAGVSRPTLYAHFPAREDLIEAAVRRALEQTQDEIAAAGIQEGTATDALQRLISVGWQSLARRLSIARVALDLLPPERLRELHHEALQPMRELIARGQHTGEFRNDQPTEWMVSVLYALLHAAADNVTSGRIPEHAAGEYIQSSTLAAFKPANGNPSDPR